MTPTTGELLVVRGVATAAQVEAAVRDGKARGEPLCTVLLEMGLDEGELVGPLAERLGVPGVDLSRTVIPLALLDLVPRAVAEADRILPLSDDGGRLHLAMVAPDDERVLAEVRFVTGREVSPYAAVAGALERAIGEAYDARASGADAWRGAVAFASGPSVAAVLPPADEIEVLEVEPLDGDDAEVTAGPPLPGASRPGEGCAAAGGTGAVPLARVALAHGAPAPTPSVAATGPGRTDGRALVLVVDDEPEIRQLVQRALERTGYAVECAADGAQAIALAEALQPDLVLLDAMLPRIHGFEACRRLKSAPETRGIPVVMMTAVYRGWRFAEDARDAYGATDYVEKPFRLDDLLRRVAAALDAGAAGAAPASGASAALVQRGKELLLGARAPEAVPVLEQAVQGDPWSAEAQYQLARALRATGDHFRAMSAFERATELRPGHLSALRALAVLYEEKGFRRKATETLERALQAASDEPTRGAIREGLLALIG